MLSSLVRLYTTKNKQTKNNSKAWQDRKKKRVKKTYRIYFSCWLAIFVFTRKHLRAGYTKYIPPSVVRRAVSGLYSINHLPRNYGSQHTQAKHHPLSEHCIIHKSTGSSIVKGITNKHSYIVSCTINLPRHPQTSRGPTPVATCDKHGERASRVETTSVPTHNKHPGDRSYSKPKNKLVGIEQRSVVNDYATKYRRNRSVPQNVQHRRHHEPSESYTVYTTTVVAIEARFQRST